MSKNINKRFQLISRSLIFRPLRGQISKNPEITFLIFVFLIINNSATQCFIKSFHRFMFRFFSLNNRFFYVLLFIKNYFYPTLFVESRAFNFLYLKDKNNIHHIIKIILIF